MKAHFQKELKKKERLVLMRKHKRLKVTMAIGFFYIHLTGWWQPATALPREAGKVCSQRSALLTDRGRSVLPKIWNPWWRSSCSTGSLKTNVTCVRWRFGSAGTEHAGRRGSRSPGISRSAVTPHHHQGTPHSPRCIQLICAAHFTRAHDRLFT